MPKHQSREEMLRKALIPLALADVDRVDLEQFMVACVSAFKMGDGLTWSQAKVIFDDLFGETERADRVLE